MNKDNYCPVCIYYESTMSYGGVCKLLSYKLEDIFDNTIKVIDNQNNLVKGQVQVGTGFCCNEFKSK